MTQQQFSSIKIFAANIHFTVIKFQKLPTRLSYNFVRHWLTRNKTRGCQGLFQNKLAQSWYLVRRLWKAHQLSVKFPFAFSFSFLSSVFIWAAFEVLGTAFAFWAALHPAEEQFMGRAWRAHEFFSLFISFRSSSFLFCFNGSLGRERPLMY